eukprot:1158737-Pelagomonas_calceolata.AAC.2
MSRPSDGLNTTCGLNSLDWHMVQPALAGSMRACSQLLANWQHIDRFAQKSVLAKRFDANKHKMTDATRKKQHISFSILTQQESKRSVINTMRFLKREQKATSGIQAMVKRQEEPKRKPMMALQQQPAQSVDCSPKGFLRYVFGLGQDILHSIGSDEVVLPSPSSRSQA